MEQSTFAIEKVIPKTKAQQSNVSLMACAMAGVGFLLCLTGIGALLGIPLIVSALYQGRIEMKTPNHIYEAPCPYCGTLLHVPVHLPGSDCPVCAKRFLIRFHRFERVD